MKNRILLLLSITFLAACSTVNASEPAVDLETAKSASGQIAAGTHFEPGKGVVMAEAITLSAIVLSVDKQDRSIVVKAANGEAKKIELTEDVKNFDQIDPGDAVVIEMYSALAMQLAKPGEEFSDAGAGMVGVAQPGDKPKMVMVDVVRVLAEISSIDEANRVVTVTGPLGKSVKLQVPEDLKKFDELKVGDEVNASYFEAFAMSVQETN
jgi:hypothetical protein